MSKFNTKSRTTSENHAGGVGYIRTDTKSELISIVINSLMNGGSFYEGEPERVRNLERLWVNLVMHNEFEFLIKLFVYTRTEMNLRSVSHIMGILAVESIKGIPELRLALGRAMIRPDDATEMVALWNHRHPDVNIPNSLRRAIRDNLENRWDAYRLKKYYGTGAVKVPDLIKLSHPTGNRDNDPELFKQALEGTLPNIETAQTVNAGTVGEQRAEAYNDMLRDGKLGLMAALKNIRNIVEAELNSTSVGMLGELLSNEGAIKRSRVLPFRFYQAYNAIWENSGIDMVTKNSLLKMVEKGFSLSACNIEFSEPNDRIAFMLDSSASMNWLQGMRSARTREEMEKTPFMLGKVMMAATMSSVNKENCIGLLWADRTQLIDIDAKPLKFVEQTRATGGGTNLAQAIQVLIDSNTHVDMMVVYTDMQIEGITNRGRHPSLETMLQHYKKINPNIKVVFWNLNGYGTSTPLRIIGNTIEVNGFSEKMIEMIPLLLENKNAMIERIMETKI